MSMQLEMKPTMAEEFFEFFEIVTEKSSRLAVNSYRIKDQLSSWSPEICEGLKLVDIELLKRVIVEFDCLNVIRILSIE